MRVQQSYKTFLRVKTITTTTNLCWQIAKIIRQPATNWSVKYDYAQNIVFILSTRNCLFDCFRHIQNTTRKSRTHHFIFHSLYRVTISGWCVKSRGFLFQFISHMKSQCLHPRLPCRQSLLHFSFCGSFFASFDPSHYFWFADGKFRKQWMMKSYNLVEQNVDQNFWDK